MVKTISGLKRGEAFTLRDISAPKSSQVYVRGYYERSSGKYSCCKFDDINAERFFRGDKTVYTDFTF